MSGHAPEHWSSYSGPASWYTVHFPPEWQMEETAGVLSLIAPHGGGLLTVKCFWVPEETDINLKELINLNQLFPRRRKVRPLKPLDIRARSLGFEGEVCLDPSRNWWQRVWGGGAWRRWRVWAIRDRSVCLLVLYLQGNECDPEAETLTGMILNTLGFSERQAEPPSRFAERVLELARKKFPLLECEPVADFQLRIGESNINLLNFYRSYVNAPDQFESIMLPALTTAVQVQGWGKEQMEPPLEAVRERIMPMLYPEQIWSERFPNFVGSSWVAGLVVLYVVDESQAYWYIRDDLMEHWGLALEELHDLALQNLDRYFEESPMEFTLAGESEGPQLLLPVRPDAYNTSRFLSGHFQQKLREVLGQEFAVGMPSRDFFVAVTLDSTATLEQVREKVTEDYQQMDHPLCDRMLRVTNDGVSEL